MILQELKDMKALAKELRKRAEMASTYVDIAMERLRDAVRERDLMRDACESMEAAIREAEGKVKG